MVRMTGWRAALLAVGVLAGAAVTGCGLYPDPPNLTVPPDALQSVGTQVVGAVVNAKDSSLITSPVTLRFLTETGGAASFVKDGQGHSITSLVVNGGPISLSIADGTSFPTKLQIAASGQGFFPASTTLVLTGPGTYTLLEKLSSSTNPPDGVAVAAPASAGTADSTGTTTTTTVVASSDAPSSVELTVPSGTTVKDANGTPLTGALSVTVASYDSQSRSAMQAMPGSLTHAVVKNGSALSTGSIVIGGFSQIFVSDDAGHQAASFSQPMPATLQLPSGTLNPLTGVAVQPGDTVPVWSLNESTGVWNNEGTGTVTAGAGGALLASFNVTHLSGWSVAWVLDAANQCTANITVSGAGNYSLAMLAELDGFFVYGTLDAGTTQFQLDGIPAALPTEIVAYYAGQELGSVQVGANCVAAGPLNVSIPTSIQPATLDVSVFNVCSNDTSKKTAVPSTAVLASGGAQPNVFGATGGNGTTHLEGLIAGSVTVYAVNRDPKGAAFAPQTITLKAGANAVEFDNVTTCTVLTGASGGSL